MSFQKKNERLTLSCIISLSLVTMSEMVKRVEIIWNEKRQGIQLHSSFPSSSSSPSVSFCIVWPATDSRNNSPTSMTITFVVGQITYSRRTVKEKAIPFTGSSNQFLTMFLLVINVYSIIIQAGQKKLNPYNVLFGWLYCQCFWIVSIHHKNNVIRAIVPAICQWNDGFEIFHTISKLEPTN